MSHLDQYRQRQKDWAERAVTQMSAANNLLLTLSSGMLAFCFDKEVFKTIHFKSSEEIDWTMCFYVSSITLMVISIAYGVAVLLARLYDFRISRHLALTRQRIFEKHSGKKLPATDLGESVFKERFGILYIILFSNLPFITRTAIDQYNATSGLETNFDRLRKISSVLGSSSWIWTKFQVAGFFISVLLYACYTLFN